MEREGLVCVQIIVTHPPLWRTCFSFKPILPAVLLSSHNFQNTITIRSNFLQFCPKIHDFFSMHLFCFRNYKAFTVFYVCFYIAQTVWLNGKNIEELYKVVWIVARLPSAVREMKLCFSTAWGWAGVVSNYFMGQVLGDEFGSILPPNFVIANHWRDRKDNVSKRKSHSAVVLNERSYPQVLGSFDGTTKGFFNILAIQFLSVR